MTKHNHEWKYSIEYYQFKCEGCGILTDFFCCFCKESINRNEVPREQLVLDTEVIWHEKCKTIMYDVRKDKSTQPTTAVEFDGKSPAKMICLICKFKTTNQAIFMKHKCNLQGDTNLK